MKIIIEKLLNENNVCFSCKYGNGIAAWNGYIPEIKEYEVEIEIEDSLQWGASIKKSKQTMPSVHIEKDLSIFIGTLESVDEHGYSVLRMGNAMVSFFAKGNSFENNIGIEIKAEKVVLTPYE